MGERLVNLWGPDRATLYRTAGGPASGPLKHRGAPASIDVLGPGEADGVVGSATLVGAAGAGVALWRLTVGGVEVPGTWIVVTGRFRPAM